MRKLIPAVLAALACITPATASATPKVKPVVRPSLPNNVTVVKGDCPGFGREIAGCAIHANEADLNGTAYSVDTVFTDGDKFTTRHELGHIYISRYFDTNERNRFAKAIDRDEMYWIGTYTDEAGRLIQDPASLDEVAADAYANCSLGHVIASGHLWEAGYDYYPSAAQHRAVCRLMKDAAKTPGTPVDADGWR